MASDEDEHLEFKEANNKYDFKKLVKYCVALANEGGGKIILGVTDKRPRKVVGSLAFNALGQTKKDLMQCLPFRVDRLTSRAANPNPGWIAFNKLDFPTPEGPANAEI